jgi:flagella basal body P-ring formation protein FlgA
MKTLYIILLVFSFSITSLADPARAIALSRSTVELKDIFGSFVSKRDTVIGHAPSPGKEFIVDKGQIKKIASEYNIPLPRSYVLKQIVIKRVGIAIRRKIIYQSLLDAIGVSNIPPHSSIVLDPFVPPIVPLKSNPSVKVGHIILNKSLSEFKAEVFVSGPGINKTICNVSGFFRKQAKVVVATHALLPGTTLVRSDLTTKWINDSHLSAHLIADPFDAYGKKNIRYISPGTPIQSSLLSSPKSVRKGSFVIISVKVPGLYVETQGIALESGDVGSVIRVLNSTSHSIVEAVVTAENQAQVDPTSSPIRRATNMGFRNLSGDSYYTRRHRS